MIQSYRNTNGMQKGFQRLISPGSLLAFLLVFVMQAQTAYADITNQAQAIGSNGGVAVTSNFENVTVPVVPPIYQLVVDKRGALNDDDGTTGLSAGDTITYTIEISNPGNRSLTNITVSDPLLPSPTNPPVFVGGDTDGDNELDPNEVWEYTGDYALTAIDISSDGGGDGAIDNTVTVDSDETSPVTASFAVLIDPNASFVVSKTSVLNDNGAFGLSAGDTVDYTITVNNNGLTNLTNVVLTDTLEQNVTNQYLTPVFVSGDTNGNSQIDPGETFNYQVSYPLTQTNIDDGNDLINTVSVVTDQIGPIEDDDTLSLSGFVDSYNMTKLASLNDLDGDNLGDENETITYTFRFTNTGNRSLSNLTASDPLSGLSAISCAGDIDNDGDVDTLAPGLSADCTATYTIQNSDLSNGLVRNAATSTATRLSDNTIVSEDNSFNDNSTVTPTDSNFALAVRKTDVSATEVLANVVEIEYLIEIVNQGNATQTNISAQDDITAAISAPALLIGDAQIVGAISGFSGTGGSNLAYNGSSNIELLSGDVQLAANATGIIRVKALIDRRGQSLATSNVVLATTDQIAGTVPSDDPDQTPGDTNDVNPTLFNNTDTDGDGSPDNYESASADRDGDGVSDQQDYDPTGYFYCEADGRIISNGRIAVENRDTGGIQSGVGSSNNITIVHDGSSGFYQFYTTAAGRYRLITTLPPNSIASTTRTSSGTLDLTDLLPANPAVIGGGEVGSTGVLNDFSAAGNVFYTEFEIELNDPAIFNNNIALEQCGAPQLAATKIISGQPVPNEDGTTDVTFEMDVENTGTLFAVDISLTDDLNAVFGAGNFTVTDTQLVSAPVTFGASIDPFYDGDTNTELLTVGGRLEPNESITLRVTVRLTDLEGNFVNTSVAGGFDPSDNLNGAGPGINVPLPNVTATASLTVMPNDPDTLIATKTSTVDSARLGEIVPYTITFTNNTEYNLENIDFVDLMPRGFTYVPGSASIDGVPTEPNTVDLQKIIWNGRNVGIGETTRISLSLAVGAGIKGTKFTNTTFARASGSNSILSNMATAVIELEIEAVFQCSHVIGRVFDDLDKDGYHDPGEPGLAGVRVATVNGLLITTDQYGRYHIACSAVPDESIGSNFILKVDTRTLPTGYIVTSENPRVMRLTQGKLSKINFAAANLRVVRVELTDESFSGQGNGLKKETLQKLGQILALLGEERSVLELDYASTTTINRNKTARLRAVKKLMLAAWKKQSKDYPLEVVIKSSR